MTYLVNDIFYTLQGEGYWTGRPAVFVRMSRCNLWTGREEDRATAICKFCDTNFLKGERYTYYELLDKIIDTWPSLNSTFPQRMVVFTGGEPSLQLDDKLLWGLRKFGFYTAIETNGTRRIPDGLDWVCVSPKAGSTVVVDHGDELKIVFPQDMDIERWPPNTDFDHYWLSPMDGPNIAENTAAVVNYCLANPHWRLNVQTHKAIGVK